MDNKFIVCLVLGAIALAAIAVFATNPEGQAILRYTTTTFPGTKISIGNADPIDAFTVGEYTTVSKYSMTCRKTYKTEALIIQDTEKLAKFKVNGETTDALAAGESYTLSDGANFKVLRLSINEGSESAGADKATAVIMCKLTPMLNK